jgi:hypothetical protein
MKITFSRLDPVVPVSVFPNLCLPAKKWVLVKRLRLSFHVKMKILPVSYVRNGGEMFVEFA